MLLFSKGVLGGIVAVVLVWIATVGVVFLRPSTGAGPGSVASGWDVLLRSPLIVLLLAVAFGVGFWIVTRFGTT
jgi:hypothetical protein